MYELIQHGEIKFPTRQPLSPEAVDLITKLLNRNPEERLGATGPDAVKSHAFFANVDWEAAYNKTIPPPFVPTLSGELDTGNFDEEFTSEEIGNTLVNENRMALVEANQDQFTDF
jgi:serine/threonine protein kinase